MMINDLLDISRIEAGLMRYNFQESSIQDIIRKSVDEIRFLAENKKNSYPVEKRRGYTESLT